MRACVSNAWKVVDTLVDVQGSYIVTVSTQQWAVSAVSSEHSAHITVSTFSRIVAVSKRMQV